MNEIIQAYLKILLSWQTISFLLVLIFRKPISLLLISITHGFEAKIAGITIKVPPLEIKEESTDESSKIASITIPQGIESGLNQFQISVLTQFYQKGGYDTLNVSSNLIKAFRELKELGFLNWTSEDEKGGAYALKNFDLTKTAKNFIESIN